MSDSTPESLSLPRELAETELLLASQMRTAALVLRAHAHDARTPLNAMQLSLELLAGSLGDEGPWQRHLTVLRDECGKLNRTLEALIASQQPLRPTLERFDLRDLAREVMGLVRGQAARQRVQVGCDTPEASLVVEASRDRLRQALLNVAVHALERMGDAPGRLRIEVEGHALGVTHSGAPTPPEALYAPGLWAARLAAESHGGTLLIEPGSSTERIRLSLPA